MKKAILDGFSRYEIFENGIVRYRDTGKICPHYDDGRSGYRKIKIYPNGSKKRKSFWMSRLVWEAFNGKIKPGIQIDHMDGERTNNHLCNLIAVTPKQNCLLKKQREKSLFSRNEKKYEIKELYE